MLPPTPTGESTREESYPVDSMSAFRKSAKIWRVTWSGLRENQITHEQIRAKILDNWGDKDPWYVIGKELHKEPEDPDKPWHFHAHIQFASKVESENCRILDIDDGTEKGVHPKITGTFGPCYASKDGDYITNRPDEDKWKPPPVCRVLEPKYDWQLLLRDKLSSEPDRTTIQWLWEPTGGCGKTEFMRWAVVTKKLGPAICLGGKSTDMKHGVAKMVEGRTFPRVIFINVVRGNSVSYPGLEAIKDGIFFSSKYDSGMVCYDPPHVVVFSNAPPDESRLSAHKWDIIEISM